MLRQWARLSVVVITVLLLVSDWPSGWLQDFWLQHPFWTSVWSGFLLILIGILIVDALLRASEERRWQRISVMAFKAVGFAADELRNGMEQLLTGTYSHFFNPPFEGEMLDRLTRQLAQHASRLAGFANTAHQRRLEMLLHDRDLLWLIEKGVDALKHRHRAMLALWMPLTTTSDEFARIIQQQADLNESVAKLQLAIRELGGFITDGSFGPLPKNPEEKTLAVLDFWDEVAFETVLIQESLMRRAGYKDWINGHGRACLTEERRSLLDKRLDDKGQNSGLIRPFWERC